MEHSHEILKVLGGQGKHLREFIPAVYSGYAELDRAVMAEGALSVKTKQLIALAIGATRECDGCVASHARAAAREHASAQEVAEAMGVVIAMNGGPGTIWAPRALAAFEEFTGSVPAPSSE